MYRPNKKHKDVLRPTGDFDRLNSVPFVRILLTDDCVTYWSMAFSLN